MPCIGVAKLRLIGRFVEPGAGAPSLDQNEVIGAALRSRSGVKPAFVASGHRVGLASAIRLALACTGRYRLPEPARRAHRLASAG